MAKTKLPVTSEKNFTDEVLGRALQFGWKRVHFRPARTEGGWRTAVQGDGKGWPDGFFIHPAKGPGWVFVAELKKRGGKATPEQLQWLSDFRAVGISAFLWDEDDWTQIIAVLRDGPNSHAAGSHKASPISLRNCH